MLGDNKAYFDGVQQDGATQRTRYYERALLLVKRAVLLLIMVPFLIGTDSMTAEVRVHAPSHYHDESQWGTSGWTRIRANRGKWIGSTRR